MASRQKSFLEQKHSAKKQPWRPGNKPFAARNSNSEHAFSQPKAPKPPLRASTQARHKLSAFVFDQSEEMMAQKEDETCLESDKENVGATKEILRRTAKKSSEGLKDGSKKKVVSPSPLPKAIPSTPGVSLEDLFDESHERESTPPRSTPKDQVGWDQTRINSSQLAPLTPSLRRDTKRARSISPPSSSREKQNEEPKASLTMKTPLKTQRYDPGPELWSRYARNSLATPSRPPATADPYTSHPSPQDSFQPSSRSIRRSLSDITHLSARKRRRVGDRSLHGERETPAGLGILKTNTAMVTRIPLLLEKLKEATEPSAVGQAKADVGEDRPSSSSPLPVCEGDQQTQNASQQLAGLAVSDCPSDVSIPDMGAEGPQPESEVVQEEAIDGLAGNVQNEELSDIDVEDEEFISTCFEICRQANTAERAAATVIQEHGTTIEAAAERVPAHDQPSSAEDGLVPNDATQIHDDDIDLDDFDDDDFIALEVEASTLQPHIQGQQAQTVPFASLERQQVLSSQASAKSSAANLQGGGENPIDLLEDDFDSDDIEDVLAELGNEDIKRPATAPQITKDNGKTIQRYLVKAVHESEYDHSGCPTGEKVLLLEEEKTKSSKAVILRGAWFECPCAPGAFVHIIGKFDRAGHCTVDDAHNMLILHPDHLISATVIADSFSCIRRAVLQDRVKATSEASAPQVYGHILHEIFQEALKANRWDTEWFGEIVRAAAQRFLEQLYEIKVEIEQAVDHLMSKVPELQSWAELFVSAEPKPDALVKDRSGAVSTLGVNKLLDVEEHIWSPMYGLKGNIDATVQVTMKEGTDERTLLVPLEVKTGKNTTNAAHKAQTSLYTLLLSDRYDVQVAYGILYYMETSEMSRIAGIRTELMHMIIQRNELAAYLVKGRYELPPMLKNERLCRNCYAKVPCFTYHKLLEDGNGETSGLKEKFEEAVQHLQPAHQDFFRKWDNLLMKEETDMLRFRRELWTMTSSERERVGRCFAELVIEPGSAAELPGTQKINRYKYTLTRAPGTPSKSFTESQIVVGEPVVISDELGHYALANGYVTNIRKSRITVAVDRPLHKARTRSRHFDLEVNQNFAGIMRVEIEGAVSTAPDPHGDPIVYRLDKDEFSNGMALVRSNLICMMESDVEKDIFSARPLRKLRKLVVDKQPPIFIERTLKELPESIVKAQANLNVDQKAVIGRVMAAKDYALVLGMPGTGKTTTIAHIIRTLTAQGKRVLLTSYTHTAVDNILLKIRNDGISIFRLGAVAKVHPEVQEFADLAGTPKATIEELKKSYASQVVATTCLGVNHPIFNQHVFDYCIVDEASQITLPVCLGPVRMARTFILVGDHYQLPPLVQNKEALEGGLDVSLFKYLSDAHPSSVVTLEHQYRMCSNIMALSNELVYSGRLKCGTEAVASQRIRIPDSAALANHHHTPETVAVMQTSICPGPKTGTCWLHDALDPSNPVLFLNTDAMLPTSAETTNGSRIVNHIEVTLATQLVIALLTTGVAAEDIGVITLYRSQLALLRQGMRARSSAATSSAQPAALATSSVEMHTADKFQGRDKEVVVLSLVRSNDANKVGDLLKDWRRVNVALTRARTKLIIIGSWKTMSMGNELLGKMCTMLEGRGCRYDLRKDANEEHYFEDTITQTVGANTQLTEVVPKVSQLQKRLREDRENRGGSTRKSPKKGKIDVLKLAGSRPVLRDILNGMS